MKATLPYPLLSFSLAILWLLLQQSLETTHLLLAALVGISGGWLMARMQPPRGRTRRRVGAALALLALVLEDIVRSNLAVARITLHPAMRGRTAGFLDVPFDVRHPGALAVLACIVTATPGTSWARYDARRNVLTLHVLDLRDEQAWVEQFKQRYETRLMEIFV